MLVIPNRGNNKESRPEGRLFLLEPLGTAVKEIQNGGDNGQQTEYSKCHGGTS